MLSPQLDTPVTISPELVRRLFQEEELPGHRAGWTETGLARIVRYGAPIGSVIHHYQTLDRGMDEARRLIAAHETSGIAFPSGTVIMADCLTGGKGRFDRVWHAPVGGVWLTVIIVNTLLPEHVRLYPMAAGIACCELLRQYGVSCSIKWINDVLAGGRKVSGTLMETVHGRQSGEEYLLIGLGVNGNNSDFPGELGGTATSVAACLVAREPSRAPATLPPSGRSAGRSRAIPGVRDTSSVRSVVPVDLHLLAARLVAKLAWYDGLLRYVEETALANAGAGDDRAGQVHPLLSRWQQLSDTIGRRVLYGFDVQKSPLYTARAVGLSATGGLIMEIEDDGSTVIETGGEVVYIDSLGYAIKPLTQPTIK